MSNVFAVAAPATPPMPGSPPPTTRLSPAAQASAPWWREPMVWVMVSGPAVVVVASLLTAVIAWRHIDPVIVDHATGRVVGHAGDDVAAPAGVKDAHAPAQVGRNHSASPRE